MTMLSYIATGPILALRLFVNFLLWSIGGPLLCPFGICAIARELREDLCDIVPALDNMMAWFAEWLESRLRTWISGDWTTAAFAIVRAMGLIPGVIWHVVRVVISGVFVALKELDQVLQNSAKKVRVRCALPLEHLRSVCAWIWSSVKSSVAWLKSSAIKAVEWAAVKIPPLWVLVPAI
jgi:predicted outer membrane lipoprotein